MKKSDNKAKLLKELIESTERDIVALSKKLGIGDRAIRTYCNEMHLDIKKKQVIYPPKTDQKIDQSIPNDKSDIDDEWKEIMEKRGKIAKEIGIDDAFVNTIKYKAFSSLIGEDIDYKTIQSHLEKTDQLKKNEEEFMTDDEFSMEFNDFISKLKFVSLDDIREKEFQLIDDKVIKN